MADMSSIFRAYDVRGATPSPMTPQAAYSVARAFACFLRDRRGKDALTVALGRDSRPTSLALHQGVTEALLKEGVHIVDIGECSSPMLGLSVREWELDGGVMVTASHNSVSDNGLKLCREGAIALARGSGLDEVQGIAERGIFPRDERTGSVTVRDAREVYARALDSVAPSQNMSVVCDTGWGASALMLPLLGEQYIVLHAESDLSKATHRSTALNVGDLHDLHKALKDYGAEWGFAFDSDEDRMGVMHRDAGALTTDDVAFILSTWAIKKYPLASIVGDLTLSRDIACAVEDAGGTFVRSRVGHSFVEEAMRSEGAVFGAESSGHYFFKALGYKDSGLAAMRAFCEAATMMDVLALIKNEKQYTVHTEVIPRPAKTVFLTEELARIYSDATIDWFDGLSVRYNDWGFVLRESQTEMVWRLIVEEKRTIADSHVRDVRAHIQAILDRAR